MPAVTKHIWVLERWSMISSMHSSAAARPTSGCEPAPRPSVTCAPSWISRSAFDMVSACASVFATTKSTPRKPAVIMLLTALPPPPPTPNTVMRGFSSVMSGFFRLIVIVLVLCLSRRCAAAAAYGVSPSNSRNCPSTTDSRAAVSRLCPSFSDGTFLAQGCSRSLPPADRSEALRPWKMQAPWPPPAGLPRRAGALRAHCGPERAALLRADEDDSLFLKRRAERRALGQEAIAGMYGLGPRILAGLDDTFRQEIALGRGRRADMHRLVGHFDMQRVPVRIGKDRNSGNTHLLRRLDDATGDFAAIGDQYLLEHADLVPWLASPFRNFARVAQADETPV